VGDELFHADGQTDMTKLTVTFQNVANAPKNKNKNKTENICITSKYGEQSAGAMLSQHHTDWQVNSRL
jgi:hypothetical protein